LETRDLEEVASRAAEKRRVLGVLLSLLFDPEPLIVWRSIEAMGAAADRIALDSPEYVRSHLRRLHWLISEESGGICWHAPEAMAEIVRRRPTVFPEYVPIVVSLLRTMAEEDLVHFRAGILWAIGRLSSLATPEVAPVLPAIVAALEDADAQVRGMAAWCLGSIGRTAPLTARAGLLSDAGEISMYEEGQLLHLTVGALVRRTLDFPPVVG